MSDTYVSPAQLRENYRSVTQRIGEAAAAAGRRPQDVLMVAVTKYATPDQIRLLVELGQQDLGENRVQQLVQRAAALEEFLNRRKRLAPVRQEGPVPGGARTSAARVQAEPSAATPAVRWHMIGHLQRNKIKTVAPLVRLIHSVDTLRLAEDLHAFAARTGRTIDVLLQVNAAGEPRKFGVALPAAFHLAQQIDSMVQLRLRGLMSMAPYSDDPADAQPTFARVYELFQELRAAGVGSHHLTVLSMGMSNDFETAIACGANLVRIGSALFGPNPNAVPDQHEDEVRPEPGAEDEPT